MLVTDYTSKIKEICDLLGSINVPLDKDEMVYIYLGDRAKRYGIIWTSIYYIREVDVLFQATFSAPRIRKSCGCINEHLRQQQDVVHGVASASWSWWTCWIGTQLRQLT